MRVLAFNPYNGGSHRQFLEDWAQKSEHNFTQCSLPPRHFKWRIRQASVGLAAQAKHLASQGHSFDVLWTTSMLDAAELRGLLPREYRNLPLVVYFHENQLVYPSRKADSRDTHFPLINWASALAADSCWFNSAYNKNSFLSGMNELLRRMPDEKSLATVDEIAQKSQVVALGLHAGERKKREPGPLHIVWVGRWEHDKRPDIFFKALMQLKETDPHFRLTCLGQSFRSAPPEFAHAKTSLTNQIEHMGFVENREAYRCRLSQADVVVSTAAHEFFGLALLEAVGTGCYPLVPHRLVYPELYPPACLYSGGSQDLALRLRQLAAIKQADGTLEKIYDANALEGLVGKYDWSRRTQELDEELATMVQLNQ